MHYLFWIMDCQNLWKPLVSRSENFRRTFGPWNFRSPEFPYPGVKSKEQKFEQMRINSSEQTMYRMLVLLALKSHRNVIKNQPSPVAYFWLPTWRATYMLVAVSLSFIHSVLSTECDRHNLLMTLIVRSDDNTFDMTLSHDGGGGPAFIAVAIISILICVVLLLDVPTDCR